MENETQSYGMTRLNEPAPAFNAPTTDGMKTLEDYKTPARAQSLFSHFA